MGQVNQSAELGPGPPAGPPSAAASDVDPELLRLPAPPRARRLVTMTVMALVVAAALALVASLRTDVTYFFSSSTAVDLGDARLVDPARLTSNAYVRIEGTPMAAGTVRYSRILGGDDYEVFPLAGQRVVFVQLPLSGRKDMRTSSRRDFAGRLLTFGQLGGRFATVRRYLARRMHMPVSSESFLVLADEPPQSYGWALLLAALCLLFVAVDVVLLLRWFRPLPAEGEPEPEPAPEA